MRLLALLPLLAVAVAAHGHGHDDDSHLEKRSQPGAPQPNPVDLTPLTWGDVNIIHTTGMVEYIHFIFFKVNVYSPNHPLVIFFFFASEIIDTHGWLSG
jgi:hypothetical protein